MAEQNNNIPYISVIVPVYNAKKSIRGCIEALLRADYPKEKFEIIVVDNNSDDETASIVKEYPVRYVFEGKKGPSSARNAGARVARGDILAFTDSDVVAGKDWLSHIANVLADKEIDGLMGKRLGIHKNIWSDFFQKYYEVSLVDKAKEAKSVVKLDAANFAVRKQVFIAAGGFDPEFMSAEDEELGMRLFPAGRRIVFSEKAEVSHNNPDSLRSIIKARREQSFYGYRIARRYTGAVKRQHFPSFSKWRYRFIFLENRVIEKLLLSSVNLVLGIPIAATSFLLRLMVFGGLGKIMYPVFSGLMGLVTYQGRILSRAHERGYGLLARGYAEHNFKNLSRHAAGEKKRIRVMHVNGWFNVGGIEELLRITAKYNDADKYDLSFAVLGVKNAATAGQIEAMGYPVYGLGASSRLLDTKAFIRLVRLFKTHRPHIVHFYDKCSIQGRIAAKTAGVPVIICNEVNIDFKPELKLLGALKRRLDIFSDKVIACSKAVREYRDKKGSDKYAVQYIPCDTGLFSSSVPHPGTGGFKNGQYPVIGTVSRISPEKGQRYLVEAMPRIMKVFPSVRLKIVGIGPALDEMKKIARSLNLNGSIEFTGFAENIQKELSSMDIFVLPSLTEGFPVCLMEAMAAGLPIAATSVGGVPEMIENGISGSLFPSRDPRRLAEAVISLLSDKKKAEAMAGQARRKVMTEFSPQRYIEKLDALYQELLRRKCMHRKPQVSCCNTIDSPEVY